MQENGKPVYTIDLIIEKIMSDGKQYNLSKIISAYEAAARAHESQIRASGEPYISHPLAVAYILIEFGMDTDTVCAALLHDVVEDTETTLEDIKKMFGQDVAVLVDGVTKLGKIPLYSKEEQQAENVRKILLAMSQDIRVIVIKLCDRLHNMRTINSLPEHKQRNIALETMNIYAPIAHRLGMRLIKDELEEISFQHLDPYAYADIENMLARKGDEREALIELLKESIKERLGQFGFAGNLLVEGRVKSIYGIYKKVFIQGRDIDEIYDKYAIRIIVDTVGECYNALGIIHDTFTPIPNRFKDYIATPKPNMYQSLHTTVLGRNGVPFEVQIRTWDMHHTAEEGIAAHWKYKEGIQGKDKLENRLAWIRQIIEAQQEANDAEEIVRTIKYQYTSEEVFAFTPKGDMISLPTGSTVIDFAYAIHTEIGNNMKGAKVDGRLVSFNHRLSTGEVVEILSHKEKGHGPSRAWLELCMTSDAKSKIRAWFKKERREENIVRGRTEIDKEFKRNHMHIPEAELQAFFTEDMKRHNCRTLQDFYAAVGYGGIAFSRLMPRMKERYDDLYASSEPEEKAPVVLQTINANGTEVVVDGQEDILVKYAQCCNPLPGDDIIGFVTRGHGLSVHKTDCTNYLSALGKNHEPERWIKTVWSQSAMSDRYFRVTVDIVANDSITLIADVASVLAELKVPVSELKTQVLKNGNTEVTVTISAAGVTQLAGIINRLRKLPEVISVDRMT